MATHSSYSGQITASFVWGGNPVLSSSWKDKDVIIPHNKIFYILDGEIKIEIDGKIIIAKAGDAVLIPAGTKHSYSLTEKNYAKKFWLHFDLFENGNNFFERYLPPYKITVGKSKQFEDLFKQVLSLANKNKPSDKLLICTALTSILAFYMERCDYTQNTILENEIDFAIEYLKNNYSEKFSLVDLAKMVSLSPNYFIKKFREQTGYSPMQYFTILKMERAKFLIEQTTDSIGKIMEELGFYDAAHFSKIFKKYSGYSPKKFREISQRRFEIK